MMTDAASSRTGTERQSPVLPIILGLSLALGAPLLYGLLVAPVILRPALEPTSYALVGLLLVWLVTGGVLLISRRWERLPWASLGLRRPSWRRLALAAGLGIALSLLVPVLTLLAHALLPARLTDTAGPPREAIPAWVTALAILTAGITEETLFRAYPIERLARLTGKTWPGATLALCVFVALHLPGWGLTHALGVVLPLGLALTGLYLWKRDLLFVIVVHLVIDAPLLLIALGVLPSL